MSELLLKRELVKVRSKTRSGSIEEVVVVLVIVENDEASGPSGLQMKNLHYKRQDRARRRRAPAEKSIRSFLFCSILLLLLLVPLLIYIYKYFFYRHVRW